MNVTFAGTPEFAAAVLRGLISSGHEVGLVVSQPDARRGRGRKTAPTPVARLAEEAGLELRQPSRIEEVVEEISGTDALVVAAYGQILRHDALYAARHGAWNVHASLLPAYRGAAPVERSIMAGEKETGVTIIKMDEGLDTGDIALQKNTSIHPDTTGGQLLEKLAELGGKVVVEVLGKIEAGSLDLRQQDGLGATYAPKISPDERFVDWNDEASRVHDHVRALAPHIGARALHPKIEGPVKILESRVLANDASGLHPGEISAANGRIIVGCGAGNVEVLRLQVPGTRALEASDFLRGRSLAGAFQIQ